MFTFRESSDTWSVRNIVEENIASCINSEVSDAHAFNSSSVTGQLIGENTFDMNRFTDHESRTGLADVFKLDLDQQQTFENCKNTNGKYTKTPKCNQNKNILLEIFY